MSFQNKPASPTLAEYEERANTLKRFRRCVTFALGGNNHHLPLCPAGDERGIGHIFHLMHNVAKIHGVKRLESIVQAVTADVDSGNFPDSQGALEHALREQLETVTDRELDEWNGYYRN